LDKKLKIDTMTIKFAGIDQLTKEASLIKTHEMEKHLPDVKLFDKFVSLLLRRKLNEFNFLIQSKEERFNLEFSTGNTLLIYVTQNNLKSVVELLLLKGADPNIQNKFGNSALHIAYKNDNAFIINLLFEHSADQKIKNSNGLFPWQMLRTINN
jgi:ankyrin repeat protein